MAGVLLVEGLALDTAEAVPPTLYGELGKMAMISGARRPGAASSSGAVHSGTASAAANWTVIVRVVVLSVAGAAMVWLIVSTLWREMQEMSQWRLPEPAEMKNVK